MSIKIINKLISFLFIVSLVTIISIDITPTYAKKITDKQIVYNYVTKHYSSYQIRYFTKWNEKTMTHRANTNIVYVQIEKSVSSGKIDKRNSRCWGYIKGQHYYKTWYNKKVKKGKTVKSYYIYNPYTNYDDDIVAVVDNNLLR